MNKYTKALLSILVISMLFVSSAPFITKAWQVPTGADAASWYMTVPGVLSTDTYSLYPYEKKDLTIGFSQFGEMIDGYTNVGLQYGTEDEPGRDPFAPPYNSEITHITQQDWLEGWLINITYWTQGGKMRNVWATAQFGDLFSPPTDYGNGWIRVDDNYPGGPAKEFDENPTVPLGFFIGTEAAPEYGTGGRKTNGTVMTEPIQVLYDGPRRFVAQLVNHVYDWVQTGTSTTTGVSNVHLVDVIITIDFNKDKKEVNILKDVKLIISKRLYGDIPASFFMGPVPEGYKLEQKGGWYYMYWYNESDGKWWGYDYDDDDWTIPYPGTMWVFPAITSAVSGLFVQFSNRGEWDLGKPVAGDYKSYAHFYTEGDWDYDPRDSGYGYYPWWWMPEPTVDPYTEDDTITEGLFTNYGDDYTLTSTICPNYYSRHGLEPWPPVSPDYSPPGVGSTFDLAQIISGDKKYVGFAAYWPSLSDWSVRGIELGQWWKSLGSYDLHPSDYVGEPWMSPYLIGEWDFVLSKDPTTVNIGSTPFEAYEFKTDRQFRGVTVYGVTDLHTDVFGLEGYLPYEKPDYQWCDYGYIPGEYDGNPYMYPNWWYWHVRSAWDGSWTGPWWPDWKFGGRVAWGRWFRFSDFSNPIVGAGYDSNMGGWESGEEPEPWQNVIDREVAYQLYEKFRPWDLQKSVEKDAARWVEFGLGLSSDDEYYGGDFNHWDGEGPAFFAEDIFDDESTYDWIHLEMTDIFEFYTQAYWWHGGPYGGPDCIIGFDFSAYDGVWHQSRHEMGEWYAYCTFPEKVLVEYDPVTKKYEHTDTSYLKLLVRGVDYVLFDAGFAEDLEYYEAEHNIYVVFIDDGDPTVPLEIEEGALIKVLYSTEENYILGGLTEAPSLAEIPQLDPDGAGGIYEWITSGRDAASVDSLGASMITEAFDSLKDIPVRMPSLDMQEPVYCPTVPFLLRKFGTGNTRADYYYDYPDDFRLALKDDWSSTVPIASSNIITVGGPLANAVTEYFNEFEMAVYRGVAGAATPANDILLVSDWGSTFLGQYGTGLTGPDGKVTSVPDTTIPGVIVEEDGLGKTGIGIVSTYKDINGTVGFVVYGYSGEDTVWTSKLAYNTIIPLFLDDGNGILDWTDENDNGILDPGDLSPTPETYYINGDGWVFHPKIGWLPYIHDPEGKYGFPFWAGDDLMLGFILPDNEGNQKWIFIPGIWWLQCENPGVVELVIKLYYELPNSCNPAVVDTGELFSTDVHPVALIVEELGTISEKPQHPDP